MEVFMKKPKLTYSATFKEDYPNHWHSLQYDTGTRPYDHVYLETCYLVTAVCIQKSSKKAILIFLSKI